MKTNDVIARNEVTKQSLLKFCALSDAEIASSVRQRTDPPWRTFGLLAMTLFFLLLCSPVFGATRFAVIGDYGRDNAAEKKVADLIDSWNVDFIITVGDNNYPHGEASTIDKNIGKYFHSYIGSYSGDYGTGAERNRFWPSLGNHDWGNRHPDGNADGYINYFTLPGNERYYDFLANNIHFFILNSDSNEPDGTTPSSKQAAWLKSALDVSTQPFKFVVMHHPPYSSGRHGSNEALQWRFASWDVTAVWSGHDHNYERLKRQGIPFIVNGLGGGTIRPLERKIAGSQIFYSGTFGAIRVEVDDVRARAQFISVDGTIVDQFDIQPDQKIYN